MGSRRDKIINFLLQEQEEDGVFVLVPAIYSALYEEKRLVHTSSLTGAMKVKEILEGHESWSRVEFRMESEIFRSVSNYLKREHLLEGTPNVGVDEQLGMFMYMISHNATNQDLQKHFQHSAETVHRKMKEIFNLIPTLVERFIKVPSSLQPHTRITSNPRFWPYFQNCIGAIDGTHIPISIAEDKAAPYRNRKGTLSQNMMVACDFDLKNSKSCIQQDYPKVKKFEGKPFMLFPILASLYEGSIATGDLNFLSIPQVDLTSDDVSPTNSSTNQQGTLNIPPSILDGGQSSTSMNIQGFPRGDDIAPTTSATCGQKEEEPTKKRKQSQVALVLEEYMDFRKKQTQKLVEEMNEPKEADKFSIANCVAALEPMEDLTVAEKSKALRLFKCQLNREIFLNTKDLSLRICWLKDEIAASMEKH